MFKCTGNCSSCGKCKEISEKNILTDVIFPTSFKLFEKEGYGIAVDIGTTTIAAALLDMKTGKLISQKGCHNPQKEYGSDIISRISYANQSEEHYKDLHLPLRKIIYQMIVSMAEDASINIEDIKECCFCGNTAMSLFFAGEDVSGLSTYPFSPERLLPMEVKSIFGLSHIKGYLIPGAGGQVGGDIVAGLLTLEDISEKNVLFVDIGTNGEIALLTKDGEIYVCSTAAGPAFEGSCISCGIPAQKGAISKVSVTANGVSFKTAGEDAASAEGICGSGLISTIRNLYENRILTQDGQLLDYDFYRRINPFSSLEDHFENGAFVLQREDENQSKIYVSQKDIREFQLAKAAILSGVRSLIQEKEIGIHNIDTVYLAGGFSAHTPVSDILKLGIIPKFPEESIKLAGNTALTGLSMMLLSEDGFEKAIEISEKAKHVELSQLDNFQEIFLDSFKFN